MWKSRLVAKESRAPSLPSGVALLLVSPVHLANVSLPFSCPPMPCSSLLFSETSSTVLLLDVDTGPRAKSFNTYAHCTEYDLILGVLVPRIHYHPWNSLSRAPLWLCLLPLSPTTIAVTSAYYWAAPSLLPHGSREELQMCLLFEQVRCCVFTDEAAEAQTNTLLEVIANMVAELGF